MARKSFSIHADFYEELRNLTNEQLASLILALINWAEDKEETCNDPMCAILFRLMTAQIDRISQANSANGSKGGRPLGTNKTEKTEKSKGKPIKPSVSLSVTESDSVSISSKVEDANASSTAATTTVLKEGQIKQEQIKQGRVLLSALQYEELLSEFGEATVNHYMRIVDERANDNWKHWDTLIRRAISEKWGGDAPKQTSKVDYNKPFIRRKANE